MISRRAIAAAVASAPIALFLSAPPADASTIFGCSAGGFTGTLDFTNTYSNVDIYYKINKGTNVGGNHANIYVTDNGEIPPLSLQNNDDGIQDGLYHLYYGPYQRSGGTVTFKFVFDKSNATDPSCSGSHSIP